MRETVYNILNNYTFRHNNGVSSNTDTNNVGGIVHNNTTTNKNSKLKGVYLSSIVASMLLFGGCGDGGGDGVSEPTSSSSSSSFASSSLSSAKEHLIHIVAPKQVYRGDDITYNIKIENLPIESNSKLSFELIDGAILELLPSVEYLSAGDFAYIKGEVEKIQGVKFYESNRTFEVDNLLDRNITFTLNSLNKSYAKLVLKPISQNLTVAKSALTDENNGSVKTIILERYEIQASTSKPISLSIGVPVTVYTGDSLNPLTPDTVIEVTHTIDNNTKKVVLVSGSAELIRGDYYLNNIEGK